MNPTVNQLLIQKIAENPQGAFLICFKSPAGEQVFVDTRVSPAVLSSDSVETAKMTMTLKPEDLLDMMNGKLDPVKAFMSGKLEIDGDMAIAMKLASAFKAK
jgi:putative sterol carrier protein